MTSPIAKFALGMAAILDTLMAEGADALPAFGSSSLRQTLHEQIAALAALEAEFRATRGAE